MKMMDSDGKDDCCIEVVTPAKKKKMKQAQLPFPMRSNGDTPSTKQSKKRKLSSPSVETKSPKTIKISKKSPGNSVLNNKLSKINLVAKKDSCNTVEIIDNVETENVKENEISNNVESKVMGETPKRVSQRKLEKQKSSKSTPLKKFLQKTEKQNSAEKDESDKESVETKCDAQVSQSMSNLSNKMGDSSLAANHSVMSDTEVEVLSSDNEDKDEDTKSTGDAEKSATDSVQVPKTPKSDSSKQKKLTPKQQEKKLLSAKKKEEKQRLKMEKEKKLEEERQNRLREKKEKRKEKEEREKAEKEQKMMEKKMKEQKKQMEIEQKQKERQAKEDERRKKEEAKEEERRKKEEEKLEAERKKQKAASNFTSFFVAKKQEKSVEEESTMEVKNFMPFEVKADMKMAPICRRALNDQEKSMLDEKCNEGSARLSDLYISELRTRRHVPRKSFKTWPFEAKDDVILLDDENDGNIVNQSIVLEKQRAKLLQFSENRRPPYWGTWRKRSSHVNPRKPFSKDMKWFNYEVDSDEEWEEEEPGESLHGSDDEKDEENPDDNEYDVDNEFMVPHGYLSDEEVRADEEEKEDMSPETQKYKLKVLGEQFESERNAKTAKLKPKIIGCIWRDAENKFPSNVPQRVVDFLLPREAWVRQLPVVLPTRSENDAATSNESSTPTHQSSASSRKTRVPEAALPDLVRLIHGNTHGRRFLVKEFLAHWSKRVDKGEKVIFKGSLLRKIREIGSWCPCPEEGPMHMKACWYVPEEIRKKYVDEELPLPNRWSYTLSPKSKAEPPEAVEKVEKEEKSQEKAKEKKNVPLITQFTKKITQEEMKKQLAVKPAPATPKSTKLGSTKTPKRATLISVARGEQFSNVSKESLLKSFVSKTENKNTNDDDDDVIVLDSSSDEVCAEIEQNVKSEETEGKEDRLGSTARESEGEEKREKNENVQGDEDNSTVECNSLKGNDVSGKVARGTADSPVETDD